MFEGATSIMPEHPGVIFRRRFTMDFLFHPDPFSPDSSIEYSPFAFLFHALTTAYVLMKGYLRVGPAGLEIYWSPANIVRAKWTEVLRIERQLRFGRIGLDVLYIDIDRSASADKNSLIFPSDSMKKRFFESRGPGPLGIPLQAYQGWPDGRLKRELNIYIPEIIAGLSVK